jgi:hypothetical protein
MLTDRDSSIGRTLVLAFQFVDKLLDLLLQLGFDAADRPLGRRGASGDPLLRKVQAGFEGGDLGQVEMPLFVIQQTRLSGCRFQDSPGITTASTSTCVIQAWRVADDANFVPVAILQIGGRPGVQPPIVFRNRGLEVARGQRSRLVDPLLELRRLGARRTLANAGCTQAVQRRRLPRRLGSDVSSFSAKVYEEERFVRRRAPPALAELSRCLAKHPARVSRISACDAGTVSIKRSFTGRWTDCWTATAT